MFMFTKFKDFFKEKTLTNKLQYVTDNGVEEYTQDELDDNLFDAIDKNDYVTFVDMIERGANINKVKEYGSDRIWTPLTSCLYSDGSNQIKFLKYLINSGVELFGNKIYSFDEIEEVDIYGDINTLIFDKKDKQEIMNCILKKHPDFMEEREMRMKSNKYNL